MPTIIVLWWLFVKQPHDISSNPVLYTLLCEQISNLDAMSSIHHMQFIPADFVHDVFSSSADEEYKLTLMTWKRWITEYPTSLQRWQKWRMENPELTTGDNVMVSDP